MSERSKHENSGIEAQHDPKNIPPDNAKRIRWSFVVIVLVFTALAVTATIIASHAR